MPGKKYGKPKPPKKQAWLGRFQFSTPTLEPMPRSDYWSAHSGVFKMETHLSCRYLYEMDLPFVLAVDNYFVCLYQTQ